MGRIVVIDAAMDTVSLLFLGLAALFLAIAAIDYRRDPAGGFLNLKRRIWVRVAAIFAAVAVFLAILHRP